MHYFCLQGTGSLGTSGSNTGNFHPVTPGDASPSSSSSTTGRPRYVPPHLRSKQQHQQQQQQPIVPGMSLSDESDYSDTSDMSDAEGGSRPSSGNSSSSRGSGVAFKASRVRTAALLLVQAMAQADPAALQPYWQSILPSHSVVEGPGGGSANLLTCVLHDPVPKVCVCLLLQVSL